MQHSFAELRRKQPKQALKRAFDDHPDLELG